MAVDPEIRSLLIKGGACALSDACERVSIKPRATYIPEAGPGAPIAGEVRTLRLRPASAGERPERHLGTALLDVCTPGDVVVISAPDDVRAGSWGGLLLAGAAAAGVIGVITSGYCRDTAIAEDVGVRLFCRGSAILSARGRLIEQDFDMPVLLDESAVEPGDIVVSDSDGQVFIAQTDIATVAEALDEILGVEQRFLEEMRAGQRRVSQVLDARYERMTTMGGPQGVA